MGITTTCQYQEIIRRCHALRVGGDDGILCDFESLSADELAETYGWTLEIDSTLFQESKIYNAMKGEDK